MLNDNKYLYIEFILFLVQVHVKVKPQRRADICFTFEIASAILKNVVPKHSNTEEVYVRKTVFKREVLPFPHRGADLSLQTGRQDFQPLAKGQSEIEKGLSVYCSGNVFL